MIAHLKLTKNGDLIPITITHMWNDSSFMKLSRSYH